MRIGGGGGGGGGILYWVTKMSQYFDGMFFQICLNFDHLSQSASVEIDSRQTQD